MERKCKNCNYFKPTPYELIPSMEWIGEIQQMTVIHYDHEGLCEHADNWRPSRGDMPCDLDYSCRMFDPKEVTNEN